MDTVFVVRSSGVVVLAIEGWDASKGVQAEIAIAKQAGLPIDFLLVNGDGSYSLSKAV